MIDAEEEQRCVEGKKINDFIIKCTFSQIHFLRRMSERSKRCIERKKIHRSSRSSGNGNESTNQLFSFY